MARERKEFKGSRAFLAVLVIVLLVLSAYFSFNSFTGYVVSEEIALGSNAAAVLLFVFGVLGSWFLLKK